MVLNQYLMTTTVTIQNLKSNHCKNMVIHKMLYVEGITNVKIDLESAEVSFDYTTHNVLEGLRQKLSDLGYPITPDPNTITNKESHI